MAEQVINLGTAPSGNDGDTAREAFTKIKNNFDEIYYILLQIKRYTIKNSTYTLTAFDKIIADTSSNPITLYLPSGPIIGDRAWFTPKSSWQTNHLTINGNGQLIEGNSTLVCSQDAEISLLFNGDVWKLLKAIPVT